MSRYWDDPQLWRGTSRQPWKTAEFPAVRDVAEAIPYIVPEPRRGGPGTTGRHRRPGVTAAVRRWLSAILAVSRKDSRRARVKTEQATMRRKQ